MIVREAQRTLRTLAAGFPIVSVTGPRQSGKTVLVKARFPELPYVSLEDPDARELVEADPRGFLDRYRGGLVVDEAQRSPKLFSYLQTIADESRKPGRFVLTGSQQFGLLSGISQSLAGRVGILQLLPFSIAELRAASALTPDLRSTAVPRAVSRPVRSEADPPALVCFVRHDVRGTRPAADAECP